jgi:serine/threonine protein kinase
MFLSQIWTESITDEQKGRSFDKTTCLYNIRRGVEHIHSLGIVRCDINPMNILSNGEHANESFVIADFDSCTMEGQELGLKAGTKGWTKDEFKVATHEMDWYG